MWLCSSGEEGEPAELTGSTDKLCLETKSIGCRRTEVIGTICCSKLFLNWAVMYYSANSWNCSTLSSELFCVFSDGLEFFGAVQIQKSWLCPQQSQWLSCWNESQRWTGLVEQRGQTVPWELASDSWVRFGSDGKRSGKSTAPRSLERE